MTGNNKIKEPVRIRYKKLANGNQSIYLDIYTDRGREYEFLKLYLITERSALDKETNKNTLRLANAIKSKRIVDLQNNVHGFCNSGSKNKINFILYLKTEMERYKSKGGTSYACSIRSAINYLIAYKGTNVSIKQIDKQYLLGYIEYLKKVQSSHGKTLSISSQATYLAVVVIALNKAVEEDIIQKNPAHNISEDDKPSQGQSTREFLTLEEVRKLNNTKCGNQVVKQAFLFSCFTGLRLGDMRMLKWSDIVNAGKNALQIRLIQQKTLEPIYIPLSQNALDLLPVTTDKSGRVFEMPHVSTIEKHLKKWAKTAGITKNISYHVSRHTNATMLLTHGADIYTVSKLLGHTSVKTTQIYAKIVDEKKREAVNLIPSININDE